MKNCGIYQIVNLVNNRRYIGQSTNAFQRFSTHKSQLRNNSHGNTYLQNAWNKYGEENFDFNIIEHCDKVELDNKEKYWIKHYNSSYDMNGYNLELGGNAKKGVSEDTKLKISQNHIDVSGSKNPFYNKTHKKETINKIINSNGYKNKKITSGENNGCSKLSESDVIKIKEMLLDNKPVCDISKIFKVAKSTISSINNGILWNSVGVRMQPKIKHITNEIAQQIVELLLKGIEVKEISKTLNVTQKVVYQIKTKKTFIHLTVGKSFPKKSNVKNQTNL